MQVAIEQVHEGQTVEGFVQERGGDFDATEQAKAVQQAFAFQHLGGVPVVGQLQVSELHGVLEHLHEALGWIALDGPHVDNEAIPGNPVPFSR